MSIVRRISERSVAAWAHLRVDDVGQTLVEYALIITLVSVVAIGALAFFGGGVSALFSEVGSGLP